MRTCIKTFLRLRETAVAKERAGKRKTEGVIQMLKDGVSRGFSSEEYQKYLTVMSRFPSYSDSNMLLIYRQKPDASYIVGYKTWQKKFNRRVRTGEKGITAFRISPDGHPEKRWRSCLEPQRRYRGRQTG